MKRSTILTLLFAAAFLLAACGGSPTATPTAAPIPTAQPPTATTASTTAATQAVAPAAATEAATAGAVGTAGVEVAVEPATPAPTAKPPTLKGTPPANGGQFGTPPASVAQAATPGATADASIISKINPPPTLEELIKLYPALKDIIDKIVNTNGAISQADLSTLYKSIIQVYKDKGASGVATFLKDSGILDKLGIPLSYIDFLTAFGDKGDINAVQKLATDRKIINSKNEIVGYLTLDDPSSLDAVKKSLSDLGVTTYNLDANTDELEIGIPLNILAQKQTPELLLEYLVKVGTVPHVVGFRPPTPLTTQSVDWQKLTTVGPKTIGADKWISAGITGKGVKVGVLDMGFGGILKAAGKQLPAADQMQSNVPLDELDALEGNHGTACAMVVHGVAPDAELYIAYFDGTSDHSLGDAVQFLIDAKVQIVNFSIGSEIGPHDGTYGLAPAVNQLVQDYNLVWVTAAGNEAMSHSAFQYKDNGKGIHAFSDEVNALPFQAYAPSTSVVMNWNGNWAGKEASEYDFAILDKDGNEVVTAAEPRKGKKGDLPYQAVTFDATPGDVYYMVIHKAKAKTDNILNIFIPNAVFPDWAQVPDHSLSTPGDADGSLTVGATALTQDEIENYSSQGPTGDDRIKPDVTAPTGEKLPGYEKGFFGTSGATPLVAGAAALVLQQQPKLSAPEVKAFLTANVQDLGDSGTDPIYGAGRLAMPDPGKIGKTNNGTTDSTPEPSSTTPSARITNVDSKFNVKVKGQKGLMISVSFEVDNFSGQKGVVAVLFFDKNKKPVPTTDKNYTIGKGLGTGAIFTPDSDQSAFDDFGLFIPNSAFSKVPTGQYYFIVGILDPNNTDTPLAASDLIPIKISK